jgi:flavin-dependent dehydrogenase
MGRSRVDVVVVGGRVGGALTAIRLAAGGAAVRLLEARQEPGDTLSTHFFRGDGLVRSLEETGTLDEVLDTGAPPLRCEYFSADGAPFAQGPPQEPGRLGYCLSVRRSTLDPILFRRAVATGVDVRPATRVVDLLREDDEVVGVVDASGEQHRARLVVGADGRRSTVARLVGAVDEERHEPARAMYYRYAIGWRPQDEIGPEFVLAGDAFCYAFPSDGATTCLAVSVSVDEHHRVGGDAAGRLEQALRDNPHTAHRLTGLTWASGVFRGLPADSVWREACGPGWALVGDAATAQDPWAGLGMDSAARQAEALAESFLERPDDWQSRYARRRRARTYQGFAETTALAPDLRRILG